MVMMMMMMMDNDNSQSIEKNHHNIVEQRVLSERIKTLPPTKQTKAFNTSTIKGSR